MPGRHGEAELVSDFAYSPKRKEIVMGQCVYTCVRPYAHLCLCLLMHERVCARVHVCLHTHAHTGLSLCALGVDYRQGEQGWLGNACWGQEDNMEEVTFTFVTRYK